MVAILLYFRMIVTDQLSLSDWKHMQTKVSKINKATEKIKIKQNFADKRSAILQ